MAKAVEVFRTSRRKLNAKPEFIYMAASVSVHDEVVDGVLGQGSWCLCFQRVTYVYDDRSSEPGYRFIWRRDDGTLQAARGQARIIDLAQLARLTSAALTAGWLK